MTRSLETDMQTESSASTSASGKPSTFVWYELHTRDAATAAAFYEPVLE
jgi:hypothetical protein